MFLASLENVGWLLLMAVPGFIIAKAKLIDKDNASQVLSVILLYVCTPFVTLNAFLNTEFEWRIFINAVICFFFTMILIVGLGLLTNLLFSKLEKDPDRRGIFAYAGGFANMGYLCVPFLQMMNPGDSEILLYACAAIAAFNMTGWTFGSYLLTRDIQYIKPKRAILNPATLALLFVLPFFILNINFVRFPQAAGLAKIIKYLSDMVAPLAMVLLGVKMSDFKWKDLTEDYKVYISVGLKLIISPALSFLLILLCSTFMDMSAVRLNLIALAAMPTANNLIMFSSLYNKDTALSARAVMISTVLSIVTIPLALELLV
jgi:predicted permease